MGETSAQTFCAGIADFYSRHNLRLVFKWKEDFPAAPDPINKRFAELTPEQVGQIVGFASTLRDKAIIWCMYQSGMDISTTLSLNWSDVEGDILNERYVEVEGKQYGPCIFLSNLVREKEKVRYSTAIYKTGRRYLMMYLKERFGEDIVKGIKEYVQEYNDRAEEWNKEGRFKNGRTYSSREKVSIAIVPLFVGREGERHDSKYVLETLRDIAPKTNIVNSRFFKSKD